MQLRSHLPTIAPSPSLGFQWVRVAGVCATPSCATVLPHDEKLSLGHLLHRKAHPFPPHPRVARPPVRHGINAESGDVVDDDRTNLEPRECLSDTGLRI